MSTTVASQSRYNENTTIGGVTSKTSDGASKRKLSDSSIENSEVADSEAETEQLHETPKKSTFRKRAKTNASEAEDSSKLQEQDELEDREEETTRRSKRRLRNQQHSNDSHEEITTNATKSKDKKNNEPNLKKDSSPSSLKEEDSEHEEKIKNNHVTSGGEEDEDNNEEVDQEEEIEEQEPEESDSESKEQDSIRQKAIEVLTDIEIEFAKFRDQLHSDRTKQLEAEIEMCKDGSHPALQDYLMQLADHRDHKIELAKHRRTYQLECINNQTHASRDQLHQQFMKDQADARVMLLLETTKEWYEVNRERRAMDSLTPEYSFRVPANRSAQIHQRLAVNDEVALLDGVSRYVGFPAAPEIKVATEDEVREDFFALGV